MSGIMFVVCKMVTAAYVIHCRLHNFVSLLKYQGLICILCFFFIYASLCGREHREIAHPFTLKLHNLDYCFLYLYLSININTTNS